MYSNYFFSNHSDLESRLASAEEEHNELLQANNTVMSKHNYLNWRLNDADSQLHVIDRMLNNAGVHNISTFLHL